MARQGLITLQAERPVALDSPDHLRPYGTVRDNTTCPAFVAKCLAMWPELSLLDLGCAGGGLVKEVLDAGGFAVGIEGSNTNLVSQRAEWQIVPEYLFTADITKSFSLYEDGLPLTFDVVTAWEVMEHLPEVGLGQAIANIRKHLTRRVVFLASISTVSSLEEGVEYHQTLRPKDWWMQRLDLAGLEFDQAMYNYISPDWVRRDNGSFWVAAKPCR